LASALVRSVLVVVALLVVAWLVVGYRATRLESDAVATLERARDGEVSRKAVAEARSSLRDARLLSADLGPRVTEGFLLAATRRPREAIAVGKRVVADEPDNLEGWSLLYLVSHGLDDRQADAAIRRVRALNPYVAEDLR
jgi:hypothetical protein